MEKNYYPILVSKRGEFKALDKLSNEVKLAICPVIQILDGALDSTKAFCINKWTFSQNQVFIDFSLSDHHYSRDQIVSFVRDLVNNDVNVIPVINRTSKSIKLAGKRLHQQQVIDEICLRVNVDDSAKDINSFIEEIVNSYNIDLAFIHLIIDVEYLSYSNYDSAITNLENLITNIKDIKYFQAVIVSSGSLPINLNGFVAQDEPHTIQRFEWSLWTDLKSKSKFSDLISYSDYGIKHPIHAEAKFLGTCSIKYSTSDTYLIYRGSKSDAHPLGNGQYIAHSTKIVDSAYFTGSNFSHGDKRIYILGNGLDHSPGNAETWIVNSLTHHITLIDSLL